FAQSPFGLSHIYVTETGKLGREMAFLATEILLARRYRLSLGRAAADHAKINWLAVERHKREIETKKPNFFDDCRIVRPRSVFAQTPAGRTRIKGLNDRFAHYAVRNDVVVK